MARHRWKDWFEREELIGQISDMRVQNLQVEREVVQKRTFTRWINLHLQKCDQPCEVQDLFQEIQDGWILMALLEELSGCKLLHGFKKSSHRIFRLNNIAKVLSFLEERNVKLVSIDAADVADGNSSIILGLIWNIILFFQIKELTGNIRSQFPSSSSLSSIPTSSEPLNCSVALPGTAMAPTSTREHNKAITKLLQWVQKRTRRYGVAVQDFGKSWTSGLAFLAVIKSIDTSLVDMRKALLRNARENLEDAFRIAHYSLGIPRLLEPEDVMSSAPDEQSIMTYVSQFLQHFPGTEEREPYPLMERSISLGRLNFRDADPHHLATSREKERCFRIQKDCAQRTPKIFFSSVSEDRVGASPTIRTAISRTWFSEDLVADSPFMDVKEASEDVELADTPFATDSSLTPESFMMDSAINSPDSWLENEDQGVGEKLSASQSDSSLYDCATPWEVYRASPDDGALVHIADKVPDEPSLAESSIDEGLFSLGSFSSVQEQMLGIREEEDVENHQDFPQKPVEEPELENKDKEADHLHEQTDATDSHKEEHTALSCGGEHQTQSPAVDQSQDLATPEPSAKQVVEMCSPCREELADDQGGKEMGRDSNDLLQDEAEKPPLSADPQEVDGPPEEVTEPCCVPPGSDVKQTSDNVSDSHVSEGSLAEEGCEEDECKSTEEKTQETGSEEVSTGRQNDHLDQMSLDGHSIPTSPDVVTDVMCAPLHDLQREAQDRTTGPSEASDTARKMEVSSTEDAACDFMEPMDLFYPNKEEHLDTEPPDDQIQSWPSVFNVSALEPAPASKTPLEEAALHPMDHHFLVDSECQDIKVQDENDSPSAPKQQVRILMETFFPPKCDGLTEDQHDSQGSAKENAQPVSHDTQSPKEEVLVSPVLRHRKRPQSSQPTDNSMDMAAFSTKHYMEDSESCWSESWEAYFLFVSWLLLYCFWMLPWTDATR
uniref:calmin-like isoform X2 n=1 Tax=Doryrhamphus excisus TaxID=161450 RepID=UPI0025ADDF1C|nr:calmin-like isoform X2 [Doryrhamphus excisus]